MLRVFIQVAFMLKELILEILVSKLFIILKILVLIIFVI